MNPPTDSAVTALWGNGAFTQQQTAAASGHRFMVFPTLEAPRLVIPTRPHRASGAILNALRDQSSRQARVKSRLARSALFIGANAVLLPEPQILKDLLKHLSPGDYYYGVHLGPPRANRKPVLVLATSDGVLASFVKQGVDPLTDTLVRREADVLSTLANLSSVQVPQVIASGNFAGHPYVLQQPVRPQRPASVDSNLIVSAQTEVASIGATSVDTSVSLEATARQWLQRKQDPRMGGVATAFADLAEQWVETMDTVAVPWGSWHGDWRSTNMAVGNDRCSVWDWERFATGVPAGYDALHLFLTTMSRTTDDARTLPPALLGNCERLLKPFGVRGSREAETVTVGYLLELAGRYLDDNQAVAGSPLGSVETWLLPFLTAASASITPTASHEE